MSKELKLYVDAGSGFNEKTTIIKNLDKDENTVRFDLSPYDKIFKLRLDPHSDACVLEELVVKLVHIDDTVEKASFKANAEMVNGSFHFFLNDDPQIIMPKDLSSLLVKELVVHLTYSKADAKLLNNLKAATKNQPGPSQGKTTGGSQDLSEIKELIQSSIAEKEATINQLRNDLKAERSEKAEELKNLTNEVLRLERNYRGKFDKLNKHLKTEIIQTGQMKSELKSKLAVLEAENETITKSLSYKAGFALTAPLRFTYEKIQKLRSKKDIVTGLIAAQREIYDLWIKNNVVSADLKKLLVLHSRTLEYQPLLSIVIPVYNVKKQWLGKLVSSLQSQVYQNFEVIFGEDVSTMEYIRPYLKELAEKDSKFKYVFRKENGMISAATNSALEIAKGEFILFMDNDDELTEIATYEMVKKLNEQRDLDIIYSDEDKIDEENNRFGYHFKPAYSPELLLSYNYINHLLCVRKTLVDKVGGLRSAYDGTQDYDFILRLIEHTDKVGHIPKVLYHWRALDTSIAGKGDSKASSMNFFKKGENSLTDYLKRNNVKGEVIMPGFAKENNLGLYEIQYAATGPVTNIIVNFEKSVEELKTLLAALNDSDYKAYNIHINHDRYLYAEYDSLTDFKTDISSDKDIYFHEFASLENQAACYNETALNCKGKYLLFLNDGLVPRGDRWLTQLAGMLQFEGVGVVMPKLFNEKGKVFNAGAINDMYPGNYDGQPYNAFRNTPATNLGYFFYAMTSKNYSLAIKECFLTRTELFKKLGGFDAEKFGKDFYSFDYSHRVRAQNKRVAFNASSEFEFSAPFSMPEFNVKEAFHYKENYGGIADPFYNKNFDRTKFNTLSTDSTLDYKYVEKVKVPKVLFVSHNMNFEGAPIQMLEIMEGLLKKGKYNMTVVSPTDGPLKSSFEELGIKVKIQSFNEKDSLSTYKRASSSLQKWMKGEKFDIVYANTLLTFWALDAAIALDIPTAWCIHESYDNIHEFYAYLKNDVKRRAMMCLKN